MIENQRKAIHKASTALRKKLPESIEKRIKYYDGSATRNIQLLTERVNSIRVDTSINCTVSHQRQNKNRFILEPGKDGSHCQTFNHTNSLQVLIKGTTHFSAHGDT